MSIWLMTKVRVQGSKTKRQMDDRTENSRAETHSRLIDKSQKKGAWQKPELSFFFTPEYSCNYAAYQRQFEMQA